MENIPLLRAKLIIPEIPDKVLVSNRIKNLKIPHYRAVLVSAPAGFGKTTAVLMSLRKLCSKICWYRMEKEDSFLPVFYTHLIEALLGKAEGITDSARSLGSIQKLSEDYSLLNAVISQDVWTYCAETGDDIYMVFDDFHNVSDNNSIVETLKYFIDNMPPNIRIIVISRTNIGIKAGKLALSTSIAEIGQQELRFTKEELEKLTSKVYKVSLEPADIDRMYEYSEGWIAIITMLIHCCGSSIPDMKVLISQGGDDKQNIFRYFLNETFIGSEKSIIKDLVRISILPEFTCDDLMAVFKMDNTSETIAWLEKSNFYIQKFKLKKITYRLHSLLRSALLSVLNDMYNEKEINMMYSDAAEYYKRIGDYDNAITFLLAASKTTEAIGIAATVGVQYIDAGDTDKVTSIIQAFPEDLIQNNDYLLFIRGAALMSSEMDQSSAYLHRALSGFKRSGNIDLLMKSAGLLMLIAAQKNEMKNISSVVSQIPKFKAITKSKYARITLLICAFIRAAWADSLHSSDVINKIVKRMNFYEPLWDYTYKMSYMMVLYRKGNLQAAEEKANEILNHPAALVNDRWKTLGLLVCSTATLLMGDVDASEKHVRELASIGEKYASDHAMGYALRIAAYNKYLNRDIKGAVSDMEESANLLGRYGNAIMSHVLKLSQFLYQAEVEPAEPLARKAQLELEALTALNPGQGHAELCQGITGALCKESGDLDASERHLLKAFNKSQDKKALQSICGAAMHLADLYHIKGNLKLEEKYLKLWGNTASANGYIFFREMNYSTLVSVCARCIQKNIAPEFMYRLTSRYFGITGADQMLSDPARVVIDPKAFIHDNQLAEQKVKTIKIKLFGSFRLKVDDMEIKENEWKTRKISGILKYLIANPERSVSRETLSALFWPESDTKAASTSLRAALYELRKALARFDLAFESEEALIEEGRNGFHLCSRNLIECDTDIFTGLYKQYKKKKHSPEAVTRLLEQMVELYEGNFLENDQYDEWVDVSREHYKSIYIEVSHRLAKHYLSAGEFEHAEALLEKHMKVDPFDEKACGMLIYLNDNSGRKNQSASLRRQFEKRFEAEMGVKPDLKYSSDAG